MTTCIIIPQWVFAIVGFASILLGVSIMYYATWCLHRASPLVLTMITFILFMGGICCVGYGLYPYVTIPCFTVLP